MDKDLDPVFVAALENLNAKVMSDYQAESYTDDVHAAAERLRAVIDLLRARIDGEALH